MEPLETRRKVPHSASTWMLLTSTGIVGMLAQICLAASLRHGAVASVMAMDYTALFWATLYGWILWDRLPPSSTWEGAPLIVGSGRLIAWREHKLSRVPTAKTSMELE